MEIVNDIIFRELAHGTFNVSSKKELIRIINDLAKNGAEGVILGCTEIPLLIRQEDTFVPLFDTTMIHARYAVEYALDRQ
jgi:aspartate racemase